MGQNLSELDGFVKSKQKEALTATRVAKLRLLAAYRNDARAEDKVSAEEGGILLGIAGWTMNVLKDEIALAERTRRLVDDLVAGAGAASDKIEAMRVEREYRKAWEAAEKVYQVESLQLEHAVSRCRTRIERQAEAVRVVVERCSVGVQDEYKRIIAILDSMHAGNVEMRKEIKGLESELKSGGEPLQQTTRIAELTDAIAKAESEIDTIADKLKSTVLDDYLSRDQEAAAVAAVPKPAFLHGQLVTAGYGRCQAAAS